MYLMSYSSTLEAVWKYSMNWGLWWQVFKKDSIGKGYRLHFLFLGHKKQLGEITLKVWPGLSFLAIVMWKCAMRRRPLNKQILGLPCLDHCWTLGLVPFFVSLWLVVSGSSQSTLALPTNLNAPYDLGHQTTSGLYFYPSRFVSRCEVGFFPLTEQSSLREETVPGCSWGWLNIKTTLFMFLGLRRDISHAANTSFHTEKTSSDIHLFFCVCFVCVFRQVKFGGRSVLAHSSLPRNLIPRMDTFLKSSISQLQVFHLPQGCWWELSQLTRSQETRLPAYPVRVHVYILCYPQATFHPTWPLVTIRKVRTQIPVRISRLWFGLDILENVNSSNFKETLWVARMAGRK